LKIRFVLALAVVITAINTSLRAEELDTRPYINTPIGQNFIAVAYVYSEADLYTNPAFPLEDVEVNVQGVISAYAYTFDMFGAASKIDVVTGRLCMDGTGIFGGVANVPKREVARDFCGSIDTKIRLSYNFYGAPALELKHFLKHKKTTVIGASLQISAPTGDYDKDRILNSSINAWFFKPEIGMSIPFGRWELNTSFSIKYFTKNHDLYNDNLSDLGQNEALTFQKEPIYNLQFHAVYHIRKGSWIALNTNYYDGGHTQINGTRAFDREGNYRAGITFSQAINAQHSIKARVNTGLSSNSGNDAEAYSINWIYRWE